MTSTPSSPGVARADTGLEASVPPPFPLSMRWMMRINGTSYGPYDGHQMRGFIKDGRLDPDTEVMRESGSSYIAAVTDATLVRLFAEEQPPKSVPGYMVTHPKATDGSTVVQVNNHISAPAPIVITSGADKSPGTALLLSLLIVGAGQIYNGQAAKGT